MDDIMNGVHCVPMMAAESNTEVYRQQTQKTQKLSRFSIGIATFVHFRGHGFCLLALAQTDNCRSASIDTKL